MVRYAGSKRQVVANVLNHLHVINNALANRLKHDEALATVRPGQTLSLNLCAALCIVLVGWRLALRILNQPESGPLCAHRHPLRPSGLAC